jgi:hypothetical protein
MLLYLDRPVPPRGAALLVLLVLAGGGLYCSLYNALQGRAESPLVGMAWAAVNLLPWLAAFEIGKRVGQDPAGSWAAARWRIGFILLAAALVSIALDLLGRPAAGLDAGAIAFEALRRVPAAGLVAALLVLAAFLQRRESVGDAAAPEPERAAADRLLLLPQQIDWIKAAGNYLEIRSAGGVTLRRMTMAEAESLLAREGFIRIHRSALVNRSRVARIARGKIADEVELADGTWLKVGGAYRPFVAGLRPNGGGGRG